MRKREGSDRQVGKGELMIIPLPIAFFVPAGIGHSAIKMPLSEMILSLSDTSSVKHTAPDSLLFLAA